MLRKLKHLLCSHVWQELGWIEDGKVLVERCGRCGAVVETDFS